MPADRCNDDYDSVAFRQVADLDLFWGATVDGDLDSLLWYDAPSIEPLEGLEDGFGVRGGRWRLAAASDLANPVELDTPPIECASDDELDRLIERAFLAAADVIFDRPSVVRAPCPRTRGARGRRTGRRR